MRELLTFLDEVDDKTFIVDDRICDVLYRSPKLKALLGCREQKDGTGNSYYQILCGSDGNGPLDTDLTRQNAQFPPRQRQILIKERVIHYADRLCRFGTLIDLDDNTFHDVFLSQYDQLLNDCLKRIFSVMDPEEAILDVSIDLK